MELVCLQIDLARQKEHVAFVKSYIDFASRCGYNAVLMYLENAVRTQDTLFFNEEDAYTSEEILEMVAYAEERGIDLIPAFENLGHLEKFASYPQFSDILECKDEALEGRGFGNCGCTNNPRLYEVMDKYITDVCKLFRSSYVHMGLDEPFEFAVCKRCKAEMEKGKTKADLFYEHVIHSYDLVKKMGKTMLMWDDFFEVVDIVDRLPRDIIFCNWNYFFITDEPAGHWTNSPKRDWFAYYDKLGFRYMFCGATNGGSSTYNVDTITAYAQKYHPYGALLTSWEKAGAFYLGTYPLVNYAAKKWTGKIKTEEDRITAYQEIVQSRECAERLLFLQVSSFGVGYGNITEVCENDSLTQMIVRDSLRSALPDLKKFATEAVGETKDVLTDIYDYYLGRVLGFRLERLGVNVFDAYEYGYSDADYIVQQLDEIADGYAELERNEKILFEKYRKGIANSQRVFDRKNNSIRNRIANIRAQVLKKEQAGVLYADFMLHDGFGTPRAEIWGRYEGEQEDTLLYRGGVKPSLTCYRTHGCYTLRFKTENKPLEYIVFSVRGESAFYPMHFRHASNGEKRSVSQVQALSGNVEHENNILYNDTRFVTMGYDDGIAHFNNVELCRIESKIKVYFS